MRASVSLEGSEGMMLARERRGADLIGEDEDSDLSAVQREVDPALGLFVKVNVNVNEGLRSSGRGRPFFAPKCCGGGASEGFCGHHVKVF